ncbi:MAG: hypothetical protein H7268_04680 [Sandarakinorhabdus sp.]|nr:hypothetical protein [Sandarakinorhabdus sp.]
MIDKLEAALALKVAENARLRRVEAAAAEALADLDAIIGDSGATQDKQQISGYAN